MWLESVWRLASLVTMSWLVADLQCGGSCRHQQQTGCDIVTGTRYKPQVSISAHPLLIMPSGHSLPFNFAFQLCLSTSGWSLRLELQAKTGQQGRKFLGTDAVKPRGMCHLSFACAAYGQAGCLSLLIAAAHA